MITMEEFLKKLDGYIAHCIKFQHICLDAANGAYEAEDVYSECKVCVCEFYTSKNGDVHFPLTSEERQELSSKINEGLRKVLKNGCIASINSDLIRRDMDKLATMRPGTKAAAKAALLPYIPLNLYSGTDACAIEIENKISTLEMRRSHCMYSYNDFVREGLSFAETEAFYGHFAEAEDETLDADICDFLDSLSTVEKKALRCLMDGWKIKDIREEFNLPEKWIASIKRRLKKFLTKTKKAS